MPLSGPARTALSRTAPHEVRDGAVAVDGGPQDLAPTGAETITVSGPEPLNAGHVPAMARVLSDGREFTARVRLDTAREADCFRHGGVMPYVLRGLLADTAETGR
ncbi:hypothetical protein ACIBJC_29970 [Streptomyces sp. NPDC050509]|uniref:hypothetical protein n=1 Tax=Streptomyces sp. NPDC050509 TaxID=3365620 RepID=UPI0037ADECFA